MIKGIAIASVVMVLHAVLWLASVVVWIGSSLSRLDHPETKMGLIEFLSKAIVYVLGLPIGTTMLLMRPAGGYPNHIEWMAIGLNSAIWGFLVAWIFLCWRPRIASKKRMP